MQRSYFKQGTRLLLHHGEDIPQRGRLVRCDKATDDGHIHITARFDQTLQAAKGDVLRWDLPAPRLGKTRLRAPACDDLASVAAALAAMDQLMRKRNMPDVRVLLTRAEEVGFVGAMAACRSGIIPKQARIVALENSKSFAESPLGGGPIVRVGDRTSTFIPT